MPLPTMTQVLPSHQFDSETRRALTAHTLNSGIRLVGSSAGTVRMLAAFLPPQ